MSIGKFKKDELRSIADELKLVVPDNAKVLDLRELIQESEIYKNDKETYQAIVDCVLEEINDRRNEDENRRNENENRLEIEKIKLSQLEKELEIAKLHNQSGKSLPLQNENQLITTECNIESLIKSIKTLTIPRDNQTVQRSVLNPLADVFGGPGGSNCVVPPQGENEENKSFVATSFLKNKTRTVLLSSVQCFLRDKYGLLHEVRALLDVGSAEIFYELLRPGQIYCGDSRLLLQNTVFGYVVSGSVGDEFSEKRRLGSLMRKMQRDKVLYSEYCKVLKNYLDEGIIEKVTNPFIPTNNPVFYLPHQVIIKNESLTTKLRLVFDASAHAEKQLSLNDCLFHGVNLNPNILDLLISFRSNKIAVLADVEKAFLQISLAPKDRDVVRFLIDDGENGVQVYRFNRVLFGVNASPFLLAATIKTHIGKYMEKYPDTVRTLDHCFYVDDLVTGEDDAKSAFDLSSKAAKIMSEAGMNLRKWISNDCELMKQWQLEHFDHLNMNDFVNHPHRVLGLYGIFKRLSQSSSDQSLRLPSKRKNTKRFLLMAAGRIFDPLGFASPFTIRFKILFQEIWQRKTDWDEELLPDIREKFEQWCSEASFLCELQIPRYALQCDSVNCPECEIHTFSDASIKAYGAVSYVRLRTFDKISVHLLASKSRVAPLKVLTLPRLELMGALLAARLAKEISRVLNEKISTTNYFWTDSTIALSWIQGPSNRWKVFVANRVKEIRSLTDKDSWRHCPGKDNPSDLLTRGISADSLINCEKWWKGPSFLQEGNTVPVSNNVLLSDESAYLEELKPTERKTLTVILDNNLLNHILSVSNNFQKNLCIFSYIYRFINNCKRPSNKQIGPLRMCEIQRAEITLVKLVQQMEFNSEIKDLSCKGMVNPQSKIRNLSPFLDSENVLRVGGRLAHSKLCFDKKHQIILPNNHRLTNLILEMTHKRHLHVGPQTLLSIVRQRFWPLNGRNMCRKLVNNCIICFKAKPVTCSQIMGQLPAERISQSFPFNKVGIDFLWTFLD
ncbi:integrase catalytic domain-containing protein [Trichonephila clavipes]|uniref:Integrase catalytic domain-containing protein n=1 Tax=Trichonephila clavipes TaxID=2585209 RepID=A0A8X6SIH3_TRICX|nr:integrase catalytic domain-containing protein [Trichonephila clavipes]